MDLIFYHSSRGSVSDFAMPSTRTKVRQRSSIKYQGPFVWSKLPSEIKNHRQSILLKTQTVLILVLDIY